LDYVRSTASGIGPVFDALKDIGRELGFKVQSIVQEHPKVLWRTESEHGDRLRLKIELNTHERSPALPLLRLPFKVESSWWSGSANVLTFQPSELMATKLRALYQRSKGRDLFDLWLALTATGLDPQAVLRAFGPYRPVGYTAKSAIANLEEKLTNKTFRTDIDLLLAERPVNYNPDDAAALVIEVLLSKVL
jgi:predicted nucleotidyltransferase component of viral defense system